MTSRHQLQTRRQGLAKIRDILNSMKTLAYMETKKLYHCLAAQHRVVESVERAAADLLSFYPQIMPGAVEQGATVYLLVGSERGFCGDFNQVLLQQLESILSEPQQSQIKPAIIAIGHRLSTLMADDERVAVVLDGASVAEEVPELLQRLVHELLELQGTLDPLRLFCLYHDDAGKVGCRLLLPPFEDIGQRFSPKFMIPPVLHQTPEALLEELSEHYLFAVLHEIIYSALMAENFRRVTHLDGAVKHLDEEEEHMRRQVNALRQEEIIEEIEVLLLNCSAPSGDNSGQG